MSRQEDMLRILGPWLKRQEAFIGPSGRPIPGKGGFDGLHFRPYASAEGGTQTIGYGIKLSPTDDPATMAWTEEQADQALLDRIKLHDERTKTYIDSRFGSGTYEKLPVEHQAVLTELDFNAGISVFKKTAGHIVAGELDQAATQIRQRYYTTSSGSKRRLTRRNEATVALLRGGEESREWSLPFVLDRAERSVRWKGRRGAMPTLHPPLYPKAPAARPDPDFLYDLIPAAFRYENWIGAALSMESLSHTDDPFFNAFDPKLNAGTVFEENPDYLVGVRSFAQWQARKKVVEQEIRDFEDLYVKGGVGGFVAGAAAGLLSPEMLLPAAGLRHVGTSMLRGISIVGGNAVVASAVGELGLQSMQVSRPALVTAFNLGGAAFLGGLIGGGVSLVNKVRYAKLVKQVNDELGKPRGGGSDPGGGQPRVTRDIPGSAASREPELPIAAREPVQPTFRDRLFMEVQQGATGHRLYFNVGAREPSTTGYGQAFDAAMARGFLEDPASIRRVGIVGTDGEILEELSGPELQRHLAEHIRQRFAAATASTPEQLRPERIEPAEEPSEFELFDELQKWTDETSDEDLAERAIPSDEEIEAMVRRFNASQAADRDTGLADEVATVFERQDRIISGQGTMQDVVDEIADLEDTLSRLTDQPLLSRSAITQQVVEQTNANLMELRRLLGGGTLTSERVRDLDPLFIARRQMQESSAALQVAEDEWKASRTALDGLLRDRKGETNLARRRQYNQQIVDWERDLELRAGNLYAARAERDAALGRLHMAADDLLVGVPRVRVDIAETFPKLSIEALRAFQMLQGIDAVPSSELEPLLSHLFLTAMQGKLARTSADRFLELTNELAPAQRIAWIDRAMATMPTIQDQWPELAAARVAAFEAMPEARPGFRVVPRPEDEPEPPRPRGGPRPRPHYTKSQDGVLYIHADLGLERGPEPEARAAVAGLGGWEPPRAMAREGSRGGPPTRGGPPSGGGGTPPREGPGGPPPPEPPVARSKALEELNEFDRTRRDLREKALAEELHPDVHDLLSKAVIRLRRALTKMEDQVRIAPLREVLSQALFFVRELRNAELDVHTTRSQAETARRQISPEWKRRFDELVQRGIGKRSKDELSARRDTLTKITELETKGGQSRAIAEEAAGVVRLVIQALDELPERMKPRAEPSLEPPARATAGGGGAGGEPPPPTPPDTGRVPPLPDPSLAAMEAAVGSWGIGEALAKLGISPMLRLAIASPFIRAHQIVQQLVNTHIQWVKNKSLIPTPFSIESRTYAHHTVINWMTEEFDKAYTRYAMRASGEAAREPKRWDTWRHAVSARFRPERGVMTRLQVDQMVGRALRDGSEIGIPELQPYVTGMRQVLLDYLEKAREVGILPGSGTPDDALRYLTRLWNKAEIKRRLGSDDGLEVRIGDWILQKEIERAQEMTLANPDRPAQPRFGRTEAIAMGMDVVYQILGTPNGRLTPYEIYFKARPLNRRVLDFSDDLVMDFLLHDHQRIVRFYVRTVAPDLEIGRVFRLPDDSSRWTTDPETGLIKVIWDPLARPGILRRMAEGEEIDPASIGGFGPARQQAVGEALRRRAEARRRPGQTAPEPRSTWNLRELAELMESNEPVEGIGPRMRQSLQDFVQGRVSELDTALEAKLPGKPDLELDGPLQALRVEFEARLAQTSFPSAREQLYIDYAGAVKDIVALRDRIRGTHTAGSDPASMTSRVLRGFRRGAYAIQGGGFPFSAIPDLARLVMVHGLERVYRDVIQAAVKDLRSFKMTAKEAKLAATAIDAAMRRSRLTLLDIGEEAVEVTRFERILQGSADVMASISLLSKWTDWMKELGAILTSQRIAQAASQLSAGVEGADLPLMQQLGLSPEMLGRIAQELAQHSRTGEGGLVEPRTELWTDELAREMFRHALRTHVDSTIVTPGMGDRPLKLDNEAWKTIFQYKGYGIAALNQVIVSGMQRRDAELIHGVISAVLIGMLVYKLKAEQYGFPTSNDPREWLKQGVDRSGIFGLVGDVNGALAGATRGHFSLGRIIGGPNMQEWTDRRLVSNLLGPTYSLAMDFEKVVAAGSQVLLEQDVGKARSEDIHAFRKLMAYNTVWYLDFLFDFLEDGMKRAARESREAALVEAAQPEEASP